MCVRVRGNLVSSLVLLYSRRKTREEDQDSGKTDMVRLGGEVKERRQERGETSPVRFGPEKDGR